jgi:hypothetical protein
MRLSSRACFLAFKPTYESSSAPLCRSCTNALAVSASRTRLPQTTFCSIPHAQSRQHNLLHSISHNNGTTRRQLVERRTVVRLSPIELQTTHSQPSSEDPAYLPSRNASAYKPLHTFALPKGAEKHYQHQYADMYFLRLSLLKKAVMQKAHEAWDEFEVRLRKDRGSMADGICRRGLTILS